MRYDSPNTVYLNGPTLGEFIQDYCASKHIHCDAWIMNMAFGTERTYSENEAIKLIHETAAVWHLNQPQPQLEIRQ